MTRPSPAPRRDTGPTRRRFVAPARGEFDPACFAAPIFAGFAPWLHWLTGADWPAIAELDASLRHARHPRADVALQFIEQTPALLLDGLHYEQRIFAQGRIATRARNWHDLFNALAWLGQRELKGALNLRQVADIAHVGAAQRTRAQCALTHFDEGGALVVLRDPALLQAWDAHDWPRLFHAQRDAWRDGRARVIVFGHALLEHALSPEPLHTAKCIAVLDDHVDATPDAVIVASVSDAIAAARLLEDPQQLRPLPLSGLPGWHRRAADPAFLREAECFRPLRAGRRYPAPWTLAAAALAPGASD